MKYQRYKDQLHLFDLDHFHEKTMEYFFEFYNIPTRKRNHFIQTLTIKVNGQRCNVDQVLKREDRIIILNQEKIDIDCDSTAAKVVYEDDFVLVAHKESGILIHEDNPSKIGTLSSQVARYYQLGGKEYFVRPLHRLDKQTQGLVLFSKCSFFQPWLDRQLREKEIKRVYLAIVHGKMKVGIKKRIQKRIGRDRHDSRKMIITTKGKEATTKIQCIKSTKNYSLISCELETGRTHQIRVHLASLGYPIVNDALYGASTKDFQEMGLYAVKLEWRDPITQEKRVINDSYLKDIEMF